MEKKSKAEVIEAIRSVSKSTGQNVLLTSKFLRCRKRSRNFPLKAPIQA